MYNFHGLVHDCCICSVLAEEITWPYNKIFSPEQNGRYFAADILKCNFWNENDGNMIQVTLEFVLLSCSIWTNYIRVHHISICLTINIGPMMPRPTSDVSPVSAWQNTYVCIPSVFASFGTRVGFPSRSKILARDHSGYGLGQWETTLTCSTVSHWLSPYLEWSLLSHWLIETRWCNQIIFGSGIVLVPVPHPAINRTNTGLFSKLSPWKSTLV